MSRWHCEKLSPTTFKVVENDPYGQYPFLYVILGKDKVILIDTGTGVGNYCDYVTSTLNKNNLPYLIINTHVHFDHVGGNQHFGKQSNCKICMGSNNKTFTENYEINSLAMAHSGASVGKFQVTNWLNEGELIYLDDNNKNKEESIEVIYAPGHTPDSIALFAHFDNRLFVGDLIYPFTAIHLDSLGSNLQDYVNTLKKLDQFVKNTPKRALPKNENTPMVVTSNTETASTTSSLSPEKNQIIDEFLMVVGLPRSSVNFNLTSFFELCDWNIEGAINMFLTSPSDVVAMCPPSASSNVTSSSSKQTVIQNIERSNDDIVLSCGHVESNFEVKHLRQMLDMISVIKAGALSPVHKDGEYGEYTYENLTIMLPIKQISTVSL